MGILRDQGAVFPYPSPRPFGTLLQALGVTLLAGWCVAAACWWRGWRRAWFGALVAQGGVTRGSSRACGAGHAACSS